MKSNFFKTSAGVEMPQLIYGTAWKEDKTAELVETAINQGFRGIDTACQRKHYNEKGVGEGIKVALQGDLERSDLFVQTKFTDYKGHDHRIPYDPNASLAEQVFQSFSRSKDNLGTDYVDSYILHGLLETLDDTMAAWGAMEDLFKAGEVKQLGFSNCYDLDQAKYIYDYSDIKPAVLQNRFCRDTQYDTILREWCRGHNIVYQSFWTLTANPHILSSDVMQKVAIQHCRNPAQILFRFLIQSGIAPLTGTTSTLHMKEDLAIFDFELSVSDIQQLQVLIQ
jgi:diketogulonate reductase-like aldo/keto reductase